MYYNILSSMSSGIIAPSYTARTTAFATATAITDTTILNALNTFDLGLISNGLDTKMKALYPFVGGTATTHRFNFMDARDLDAAFRLQFNGGWTHSSTGALPNGTNAYGDTYFNPAVETSVSLNDIAIGTYLRDNNNGSGDIGAYPNSGPGGVSIMARYTGETNAYYRCNSGLDVTISGVTTAAGFNVISNPSTNLRKFYKNNSIINTDTSTTTGAEINNIITIGKIATSLYSGRQTAFSFISSGLTDTDALTLYTLTQAFQTSLSRQI